MFVEVLVLLGLACYLIYRWGVANYDFFEKRGIPYDKPFPIFGNLKDAVFRKKSMFNIIIDSYNMHDGNKYFGMFDQRTPMLVIRDPEIIKQITVKDFDHFINHRKKFMEDDTNLFVSSLFLLRDEKWKDMRSTLSPAFTGSKMRHMFTLINDVARDSALYIKTLQKKNDGVEIDVKDFTTRYTNDVIATTAFGIKVNSYEDKDNEFYRMGKDGTAFTAWRNLKFFLSFHLGCIMKLLKVEIFERRISEYFMRLVLDTMKYRKDHNISRPDMINMLMEARGMIQSEQVNQKSHNRNWTDVEIVAQCFLFFFAGFETSSILASFALHELMENPEVQKKLYKEIKETCEKLDGKPIDYESLQSMKYLDIVVSETLRKWPGAVATDRMCNKDYVYETEDGKTLEIKEGEYIWVPVVGLHHDPIYFPNPDKFDPERFSDENKDNIVPFTYVPFGTGPRNCIGSRFALLEAKALLFYLVKEFKIVAGEKTKIPIELSTSSFQLIPKNGFWLKFVKRVE